MKKIILTCFMLTECLFADVMYPTTVKEVYLDNVSNKAAGKLLPTNAIEVLENSNGKIKFSVSGYQNPSVPNVVYFSNGQRIITLAFAKTKAPNFEIIKKGEGENWNEVKVTAYTTDSDLTENLNELNAKAKKLYEENCSVCHSLHKVDEYTANQWPSLIKSMVSRTPIEKKDMWSVIEYLQKNAKDMKKESK